MMNTLVVTCFLSIIAFAATNHPDGIIRYDVIDLDHIIGNRPLLVPYMDCVIGRGPCSPEGLQLKEHLRMALDHNCESCDEKQRFGTRQLIKHLVNNEQDLWRELAAKHDPERKHIGAYETEFRKHCELNKPPPHH